MRMKKLLVYAWFFFLSLNHKPKRCLRLWIRQRRDPLVKAFKDIIYYGRQADWPKVSTGVNSISDRIKDVNTIFKIDLSPRINHAIQNQDFQTLANQMANLVFLGYP